MQTVIANHGEGAAKHEIAEALRREEVQRAQVAHRLLPDVVGPAIAVTEQQLLAHRVLTGADVESVREPVDGRERAPGYGIENVVRQDMNAGDRKPFGGVARRGGRRRIGIRCVPAEQLGRRGIGGGIAGTDGRRLDPGVGDGIERSGRGGRSDQDDQELQRQGRALISASRAQALAGELSLTGQRVLAHQVLERLLRIRGASKLFLAESEFVHCRCHLVPLRVVVHDVLVFDRVH